MWFACGRAEDGKGATYFVVSGYKINKQPLAAASTKFETGGLGLVFRVSTEACFDIGGVQEAFSARYFDETPEVILQQLAADMAERYRTAFGGTGKLRAALKRHAVKPDPQALELNAAFAPYLK